jgi:hypothetical protein
MRIVKHFLCAVAGTASSSSAASDPTVEHKQAIEPLHNQQIIKKVTAALRAMGAATSRKELDEKYTVEVMGILKLCRSLRVPDQVCKENFQSVPVIYEAMKKLKSKQLFRLLYY